MRSKTFILSTAGVAILGLALILVGPDNASLAQQRSAQAPAGCTNDQPIAAVLQCLQGTWEGVMLGHESDGKITITITGNSLHFHRDADFWFETTFTLPVGTDPQQLHATIKRCSPPEEDSIGKVVFAIFKIEDETLTLAGIQSSAAEPPRTFPSAPGAGPLFRYDLKKVHPQKKNTQPSETK